MNLQSSNADDPSASVDARNERRVAVLTDLFDNSIDETQGTVAVVDVKQSKYHQMIARRNVKNQGLLGYGLDNENGDFDAQGNHKYVNVRSRSNNLGKRSNPFNS